jgi:hypothetical protein
VLALARVLVEVPPLAVQQQEEVRPPLARPLARSAPLSAPGYRP